MRTVAAMLREVESMLPDLCAHAEALDREAAFPAADIAALAEAGVLQSVLPAAQGGFGIGTEPHAAADTLTLLRLLGRGNLSLGRLIEAHVNAARLILRYGDADVQARFADEANELFALWVSDPPGDGLRLAPNDEVVGQKMFCSGAGHAARAVVTAAAPEGGVRLLYVALDRAVTTASLPGGMAGMRAAVTGQARFDGAAALPFGSPGDYLREPDFSCGAWRTSAVTLGGMEALLGQLRAQLRARGRENDPHQQARFGQALSAVETARLWMAEAAARAEAAAHGAVAYVGLARLAVERAAFELIELVQRSIGAPALLRGNPIERICRDLATYLRQPAADAVLTEAAAFALAEHG